MVCVVFGGLSPKSVGVIEASHATFRSRLLVPVLMLALWFCFWKPAFVDQRVWVFLDGSSGTISPRGRPAREGSLLRRTWRGISVEKECRNIEDGGEKGYGWNDKKNKTAGYKAKLKLLMFYPHMYGEDRFLPPCSHRGIFLGPLFQLEYPI